MPRQLEPPSQCSQGSPSTNRPSPPLSLLPAFRLLRLSGFQQTALRGCGLADLFALPCCPCRGRSFVVGWGTNPPTHAHHRAASCPLRAGSCSNKDFESPNPNPHVSSSCRVALWFAERGDWALLLFVQALQLTC